MSESMLVVAHGGETYCEYEIVPANDELVRDAIYRLKMRRKDHRQITCFAIATPTAREPVKVTRWCFAADVSLEPHCKLYVGPGNWNSPFARVADAETAKAICDAHNATLATQPAEPGAGHYCPSCQEHLLQIVRSDNPPSELQLELAAARDTIKHALEHLENHNANAGWNALKFYAARELKAQESDGA